MKKPQLFKCQEGKEYFKNPDGSLRRVTSDRRTKLEKKRDKKLLRIKRYYYHQRVANNYLEEKWRTRNA